MAICNSCGTQFSDNKAFCPQCGQEVFYSYGPDGIYGQTEGKANTGSYAPQDNYRQPRDIGYGEDFNPAYVYSTPRDRLPLGVGGFLVSLLLMSIPLAGLIIQIVWAVGGAKNINRRNLARAYLVLTLILTIIVGAGIAALMPYIEMIIQFM